VPKDLDEIASSPSENMDATAEWVLLKCGLHQSAQACEAAAQVSHTSDDPDMCVGWNHPRRFSSTAEQQLQRRISRRTMSPRRSSSSLLYSNSGACRIYHWQRPEHLPYTLLLGCTPPQEKLDLATSPCIGAQKTVLTHPHSDRLP
jgi:hypothetical protein